MKNIPDKIYLVIDTDGEKVDDFKELEGVSWCTERITLQDVPYFRKGTRRYTKTETHEFANWCMDNVERISDNGYLCYDNDLKTWDPCNYDGLIKKWEKEK